MLLRQYSVRSTRRRHRPLSLVPIYVGRLGRATSVMARSCYGRYTLTAARLLRSEGSGQRPGRGCGRTARRSNYSMDHRPLWARRKEEGESQKSAVQVQHCCLRRLRQDLAISFSPSFSSVSPGRKGGRHSTKCLTTHTTPLGIDSPSDWRRPRQPSDTTPQTTSRAVSFVCTALACRVVS